MGILSAVFVIIGVIIGAGFASGKEIYSFFFVHGIYGAFGMLISSGLIGIIIYKTLKLIKKYDIDSYDEFFNVVMGNFETKHISFRLILDFIINIFLLITFFVMCAGFIAYFKQELGINEIISGIFVAFFSYILLNKNIKGIVVLNSILIPTIIVILFFLGIKMLDFNFEMESIETNFLWLKNAILYASYNSITLTAILIPIKKYIKKDSDILKISFLCTLIIALLAIIIFIILLSINGDISKIELPTVYGVSMLGIGYKYLYGIILLGAIVTTAISSAYSFLNNVAKTKTKYKMYNKIVCATAIFVSLFGFSNLVNNLYPFFGMLGLIQLIFVLKKKTCNH